MGNFVKIFLFLIAYNALADLGRFEGRIFSNQTDSFEIRNSNGSLSVATGQQIRHLPSNEIPSNISQDPNNLYFRVLRENGEPINQEIYTLRKSEFDSLVERGNFGNWLRTQYTPEAQTSFRIANIDHEVEYNQEYSLSREANSIGIELLGQNFGNLALQPGYRFYIEQGRDQDLIVLLPGNGRFTLNNPSELEAAFQNNQISPGDAQNTEPEYNEPTPNEQEQTPEFQESFKTNPTLMGSFETAVDTMLEINNRDLLRQNENCNEFENLSDNLRNCTSYNSYAQDILNSPEVGLLQEEIRDNAAEKFCILAGLQFTPGSLKFANCNSSGELIGSKQKVCQSKEYISFVYRELKKQSECFSNINMLEMLPLMNAESNFNFNAFNTNRDGSLNASGLLQATQALIDSQGQSYIVDTGDGFDMRLDQSKSHCAEIMQAVQSNPLPSERNVCERISIPNGFRKNLYITMAQYSYSKVRAQNILDELQESYFGSVDLEIFQPEQKEQILVDLTRLMHNRGTGRITQRLETFFYDLFHGEYGQQEVFQGRRHGNARIHTLWGSPDFKAPLEHDQFINYFSSYLFYEGKTSRGSRGRYHEPNDTTRDSEAGTYLHKMACEQQRLTLKAQEVSNSDQIRCGYPQINPERLEHTQVEVGWYYNVCMQNNRSNFSRMKCSAKDPYRAVDSNGARRLTQNRINNYMEQTRFLSLCDSTSLRGMASRPLLEYYSSEPEDYR